jgi:predicted tellurium resistance membrane protein TerC
MNKILGLGINIVLAFVLIGGMIYCGEAIVSNNTIQISNGNYWSVPFSIIGIILMAVGVFTIFLKSMNILVKGKDEKTQYQNKKDNYY